MDRHHRARSGPRALRPAPRPSPRRLLLKTHRDIAVRPLLRVWLAQVPVPRGARVDGDPVCLLKHYSAATSAAGRRAMRSTSSAGSRHSTPDAMKAPK